MAKLSATASAIGDTFSHFAYGHLPPRLQDVSKDFHDLAQTTIERAPNQLQTLHALQWLLLAKDCAVRAALRFPRTANEPN